MGDVTVSTDVVAGSFDFGLSGTLTIEDLAYNHAADGFARLDWTRAFALDETREIKLEPLLFTTGSSDAELVYQDLLKQLQDKKKYLEDKLGVEVTGFTATVDGYSSNTPANPNLDNERPPAVEHRRLNENRRDRVVALASRLRDDLGVDVELISGEVFILPEGRTVAPESEEALRNQAVRFPSVQVHYNYKPVLLNPGAMLPTPVDLTIDLVASLQFRVSGSVTGTDSYTTTGFGAEDATYSEVLLTAGPVIINGSAEFALSRATADVDTDSNGTADLLAATLDSVALSVSGVDVVVDGLAQLTVSGELGLGRVIPDGETTARYTALIMGDVTRP
jgi:hypothetical protein